MKKESFVVMDYAETLRFFMASIIQSEGPGFLPAQSIASKAREMTDAFFAELESVG